MAVAAVYRQGVVKLNVDAGPAWQALLHSRIFLILLKAARKGTDRRRGEPGAIAGMIDRHDGAPDPGAGQDKSMMIGQAALEKLPLFPVGRAHSGSIFETLHSGAD